MPDVAHLRPASPGDLAAIAAIYEPEVRHGTATFELEPPDAAELGRRLAKVRDAGLPVDRATRALGRLVDGGLVGSGDGGLALDGAAFQRAARAARPPSRSGEHADEPDARRKVLQAFVRDGQITSVPSARAKRLVVLDWLGSVQIRRRLSWRRK